MSSSVFSKDRPIKLLVDTNVWLDYFLSRSTRHTSVNAFIAGAIGREDIVLYAASLSLKDLAYQLANLMKKDARDAEEPITPEVAAAAREVSWACVRDVLGKALVAPVGNAEILGAFTLRHLHDDLEDDLMLATAESIDADALVTHDAALLKHAEDLCITTEEGLELLAELAERDEA